MPAEHELAGECLLLRIFIGESDRHEHKPLYEAIMLKAREQGLAGCTVTRALAGYGAASRIHTAHIERLSMDLPIVVEIIDTGEKVRAFLREVEAMMDGGLVTLEPIEVHVYRHERT